MSDGDEKPVKERESDAQDHVLSREDKLEEELEDSMDASDPPSTTRPGDHGGPAPSSGFPGKQD